jgi:hypothetical protein
MTRNNRIILGAIVGGVILLGLTGGWSELPEGLVGLAAIAAWVVGFVRLFMGRHSGLGVVAIFVPFVFIAGYIVNPRPGSSLYIKQSPEQQRQADMRWPLEAAAYRQALEYLKTDEQRQADLWAKQARDEIDRDIPPT